MTKKPFFRKENPWHRRLKKLQYSLFKKLTRNAMPVFVRGGDLISIQPMAWGEYEPEVVELIKYWVDLDHSDFFLDIGANIGLISCQVGHLFKQIHLFEPNPDCLSLLSINLKSMLRNQVTHLHPYALGNQKERLTLMVPFDNWGGAFILSADNEYSPEVLAHKDGFARFDPNQYQSHEVQVESAVDVMSVLFSSLRSMGLSKGVIKIDIEGFESLVLKAIASTVPEDFELVIIFENWNTEASLPLLKLGSTLEGEFFYLASDMRPWPFLPRTINSLYNFIRGGHSVSLAPLTKTLPPGTCVLMIRPCKI
jgi:FkbM family methyltransferase